MEEEDIINRMGEGSKVHSEQDQNGATNNNHNNHSNHHQQEINSSDNNKNAVVEDDDPRRIKGNDENFGALTRAACHPSSIDTLTPQEMDKIGKSITSIFRECSIPENELANSNDRSFHMLLLHWVREAHSNFYTKAKESSRHGALLVLFRKTVITPINLQALFRMCNPKIRTGEVRCYALEILNEFAYVLGAKHIPLVDDDDDDDNKPTSFMKKLISTMADALAYKSAYCDKNNKPPNNEHYGTTTTTGGGTGGRYYNKCICTKTPWSCVTTAMITSLGMMDELEMLHLLDSKDWVHILCDKQIPDAHVFKSDQHGVVFHDLTCFSCLHRWAVRILCKYPDNVKAINFLKNQLGACHELFRKCMRRIINGDIYVTTCLGSSSSSVGGGPHNVNSSSSSSSSSPLQLLEEIKPIIYFLDQFPHCLARVPVDRETMSLVRRARVVLFEPFLGKLRLAGNNTAEALASVLASLFDWQLLRDQTDEVRLARFQGKFLGVASSSTNLQRDQNLLKKIKKSRKQSLKSWANLQSGEMCANCFVLEKTLREEYRQEESDTGSSSSSSPASASSSSSSSDVGYLLRCAKCVSIKYCSRECQVEHWKKAHRKTCKGNNKSKGNNSNSPTGAAAAANSGSSTASPVV